MTTIWTWFRNKLGRITTLLGFLLQGIETIDISAIKGPLEAIFTHKGVQILVVGLFMLSYFRHQYVASKVAPKP